MGKLYKKWIELDPSNSNALTGADIYINVSDTINDKISNLEVEINNVSSSLLLEDILSNGNSTNGNNILITTGDQIQASAHSDNYINMDDSGNIHLHSEDGNIHLSAAGDGTIIDKVSTDTIVETTLNNGVNIDGTLIKDLVINGSATTISTDDEIVLTHTLNNNYIAVSGDGTNIIHSENGNPTTFDCNDVNVPVEFHAGGIATDKIVELTPGANVTVSNKIVASNGIDINTDYITNLASGSNPTDAVNKSYVDNLVATNNELSEVLSNGNTTGSNNILMTTGDQIQASGHIDNYINMDNIGNVKIHSEDGNIELTSAGDGVIIDKGITDEIRGTINTNYIMLTNVSSNVEIHSEDHEVHLDSAGDGVYIDDKVVGGAGNVPFVLTSTLNGVEDKGDIILKGAQSSLSITDPATLTFSDSSNNILFSVNGEDGVIYNNLDTTIKSGKKLTVGEITNDGDDILITDTLLDGQNHSMIDAFLQVQAQSIIASTKLTTPLIQGTTTSTNYIKLNDSGNLNIHSEDGNVIIGSAGDGVIIDKVLTDTILENTLNHGVNIEDISIVNDAINGTHGGMNFNTGAELYSDLSSVIKINNVGEIVLDPTQDKHIIMSDAIVSNVKNPVDPQDAATKNYVDGKVGANNELSEVLANGNTTGGTNILMTTNDKITNDVITDNYIDLANVSSNIEIHSENHEVHISAVGDGVFIDDHMVISNDQSVNSPQIVIIDNDSSTQSFIKTDSTALTIQHDDGGKVVLSGTEIDVNNVKVTNVATPTVSTDAANKEYVDAKSKVMGFPSSAWTDDGTDYYINFTHHIGVIGNTILMMQVNDVDQVVQQGIWMKNNNDGTCTIKMSNTNTPFDGNLLLNQITN